MRIPPAPPVPETIERLKRAAADQADTSSSLSCQVTATDVRRLPATQRRRWSVPRRIAVGGIGVLTMAGLAILLLTLNSPRQLSAMERIARKLADVKSFSYKLSTENTFLKEGQPTHVKRSGTAYWQAPGNLFAAETIVHVDGPMRPGKEDETVVDIVEIFPSGKPGILIDHKARTFARLGVLQPDDIPPYSPIAQLKMVREGTGRILRDLGTREIDGKTARGYVMALKNAEPGSGRDAVEVWVDPETDLPLELGYTVENDTGPEYFRVTDCRWNIDVAPEQFTLAPPKGYTDVTPPATK